MVVLQSVPVLFVVLDVTVDGLAAEEHHGHQDCLNESLDEIESSLVDSVAVVIAPFDISHSIEGIKPSSSRVGLSLAITSSSSHDLLTTP